MRTLLSTSLAGLTLAMAGVAQAPNWTEFKPTTKPVARQNHAMAYDSARGRTVLFGAWDGSARRDDTWEWDGATWTEITTTVKPPAGDGMAMAYDSARRVTVLTAGYVHNGQTWEYDGTNWTQRTPAVTPGFGAHTPMVYHSNRGVCVIFGITANGAETWEWNGTVWTQQTTTTSPGSNGTMAYDSLRKVTVFLTTGRQTWEYDGTNWTQRIPPTLPQGANCSAMVYDSARQVVVIFGGCGNGGDTWEYDGADWRMVQTANAPATERRYMALAYDSARRRTVFFGGRDLSNGGNVLRDDTWEYAGSPCYLTPDVPTVSMTLGGTQTLSLDAGAARAGHLFWIFGSITGTGPGVRANGVHIPLNPDLYTNIAIANTNTATFLNFRGALDASGKATALLRVPPAVGIQVNLHHAALIYLANWECASNSVLVEIK